MQQTESPEETLLLFTDAALSCSLIQVLDWNLLINRLRSSILIHNNLLRLTRLKWVCFSMHIHISFKRVNLHRGLGEWPHCQAQLSVQSPPLLIQGLDGAQWRLCCWRICLRSNPWHWAIQGPNLLFHKSPECYSRHRCARTTWSNAKQPVWQEWVVESGISFECECVCVCFGV